MIKQILVIGLIAVIGCSGDEGQDQLEIIGTSDQDSGQQVSNKPDAKLTTDTSNIESSIQDTYISDVVDAVSDKPDTAFIDSNMSDTNKPDVDIPDTGKTDTGSTPEYDAGYDAGNFMNMLANCSNLGIGGMQCGDDHTLWICTYAKTLQTFAISTTNSYPKCNVNNTLPDGIATACPYKTYNLYNVEKCGVLEYSNHQKIATLTSCDPSLYECYNGAIISK